MRTDDRSPGDARQPYSDIGGPQERHAQTHDVAREQHTNPTGPEPTDPVVDELLEGQTPESVREAHLEAGAASDDKSLQKSLPDLDSADLSQISVLKDGTPLEQGATYIDLNARARGEFSAFGDAVAEKGQKLVAKKMVDHELWARIIGTDRES